MAGESRTDIQQWLRDACETGAWVGLRSVEDRRVEADWIVDLLTRPLQTGEIRRAVKLAGAAIVGELDLEGLTLLCPLWLTDCELPSPVSFMSAVAPLIRLSQCELGAVNAEAMHTRGIFSLADSQITGEVRLDGAQIGGRFSLSGATMSNPSGPVLIAHGLHVKGNMFCREQFSAIGEIRLAAAHIAGQLDFSGATLDNGPGRALMADGLRVDGSMFCYEQFAATGEISLRGAHIGGQLIFSGARLTNDSGSELSADALQVDGNMGSGLALSADGLHVDGSMYCDERFSARGEIRLRGAHIGGQLDFSDATLINESGPVLNAGVLRVGQNLACRGQFTSRGEIRLLGVHVGGQISFSGATLVNERGPALLAEGLRVQQDVLCRRGLTAQGAIRLTGSQIAGELDFSTATLCGPEVSLSLEDTTARKLLLSLAVPPAGIVDLTGARFERLLDRTYGPNHDWVPCRLGGCRYDALESVPDVQVSDRLRWVAADPAGYAQQPYEQLANVYRQSGNDEAARRVLIAKHGRRRQRLRWPAKGWSSFLGLTVGYGYRLWFAGLWLIALAIIGSVLFSTILTTDSGNVTPATVATETAPFQPLLYAIDILLPVVNLGQDTAWNTHGAAQWVAAAGTLLGWLLTTALVAGLVIRRA